jgi:drug/metabolite transporter (DMT)-like permease
MWRGRLLVIAAAVLWSTSGFFAKAPTFANWPAESRGLLLAGWRSAFAAVVLFCFVRHMQWSWRLLPMVAAFAVMNWTYLNAMVLCEPTLAIWLQYSAPAWVFVISWLFFGEFPVRRDWLLFALAGAGVAVILWAQWGGGSPAGVRYGIASGLCFALVLVTLRWNREFEATWLVFLNNATTALLFLPTLFHYQVIPNHQQWLFLACFGVFQFALPYLLFTHAVRHVSSHEASGLVLLEPILVPLWVYVAWRHAPDYQYPAPTTLIGAGLILSGMTLRYLPWGSQNVPNGK